MQLSQLNTQLPFRNQGIEDALRSEGILDEPDGKCAVGYAICSVYIINLPKGE